MVYQIRVTPRAEREATITKRLENATEEGETIYDFRSSIYKPKVISLPIEMPVYRMESCRTFSAQQSDIAIKGLDKNFFANGQESTTAQQAQQEILLKLAKQDSESVTSIYSVLEEEGQREPLLITTTGVVVNGNRRLSAMRDLIRKKDDSVDERFTNVRCAVLPSDITSDEVDDIEADLQARPHTKLEYDWIGDARLIRRQVDKGRTTKAVADRLRRSKADIENALQALDEADLYLSEWIGKPRQYHLLKDGEQIFGDIPKNIAKKDPQLQNASRAIAWSIYENRERVSGRVYSLNAAFGKLAPKVLDILEDKIAIDKDDNIDMTDNDDFSINIDADDIAKDYSPIIQALKNETTKDDTFIELLEACETAIELDKGQKNEQAALKELTRVNAKITAINVSMAAKKTLPAMLKQIKEIRTGLEKLEETIQARQVNISTDDQTEE